MVWLFEQTGFVIKIVDMAILKGGELALSCIIQELHKTMYNSLLFLIEYGILQAETQGGDFL